MCFLKYTANWTILDQWYQKANKRRKNWVKLGASEEIHLQTPTKVSTFIQLKLATITYRAVYTTTLLFGSFEIPEQFLKYLQITALLHKFNISERVFFLTARTNMKPLTTTIPYTTLTFSQKTYFFEIALTF